MAGATKTRQNKSKSHDMNCGSRFRPNCGDKRSAKLLAGLSFL